MAHFTLSIAVDNVAFEEPQEEIARILRDVAHRVLDSATAGAIHDINGNTVGRFGFRTGPQAGFVVPE